MVNIDSNSHIERQNSKMMKVHAGKGGMIAREHLKPGERREIPNYLDN